MAPTYTFRKLFCLVTALLSLCLASVPVLGVPAHAADTVLDGIVVVVNGKIITRYELEERLAPVYDQLRGKSITAEEAKQIAAIRQKLLAQMIDDILILQDSERYKLKVSDNEVEEQITKFRTSRNLSEEDFKNNLVKQHMSRDDFVRNMRRDIIKHRLIGAVVTSKVVITDSEVEARYNERKEEYSKDSMVQIGIILLPPEMSAATLKADIEAGKMTFAQAADKYSRGPGVGSGGDMGFIAWKDLSPGWNTAIAGLKPGQIGAPLRVQDFEALLQVIDLKAGEVTPLDEVREQIYQSLHEGKFETVFQDYMEKLRSKAVIEYRTL